MLKSSSMISESSNNNNISPKIAFLTIGYQEPEGHLSKSLKIGYDIFCLYSQIEEAGGGKWVEPGITRPDPT